LLKPVKVGEYMSKSQTNKSGECLMDKVSVS
jgi:hypothetical protein